MSARLAAAALLSVLLSSPAEVTRSPSPQASRGAPEGSQPYPGSVGHVKCYARAHTDRAIPLSLSLSLSLSACVSGEGVLEGPQRVLEK